MNSQITPKVLHVLANSAPDLNGYAIRSHDLLIAQKRGNIANVVAITSPFYPNNPNLQQDVKIDDIAYYRCVLNPKRKHSEQKQPTPPKNNILRYFYFRIKRVARFFIRCLRPIKRKFNLLTKFIHQRKTMKLFEKDIIKLAKSENADIIHGHTPFRVGLPALRAAKKIGIPYVHEMRGLWEDSAVAEGRWKESSLRYKVFRSYENKILKKANWVCTISDELSKDVVNRHSKLKNRVTVIPNAVGIQFEELVHDIDVLDDDVKKIQNEINNLEGNIVIGYIGSIRTLEGVDDTVKAIHFAKQNGVKFKLLVCSNKKNQDHLIELCKTLEISKQSLITGPIAHHLVHQVYSLIDIFVVSRPPFRVTKIVPPIKPLEAMMMGIPTMCSDLPVLTETIKHQENGFLFKAGDPEQLATVLIEESSNPENLSKIGLRGRDFVKSNRCWSTTVNAYDHVYAKMLEG